MSLLQSFERRDASLSLLWSDGSRDDYPYIWLRMNSPDDTTRHASTGQILVSIADFDDDELVPETVVRAADDDGLLIDWPGMTEPARFSLRWLRAHASNRSNRAGFAHRTGNYPDIEPWLPAEAASVPVFDYRPMRVPSTRDGHTREVLQAFFRYGFVRLRDVPVEPGYLMRVVAELGGYVRETNYGRTFQVVAQPDPSHLAYSGVALGLHTDMGYRDCTPGVQLLHCLISSAEGGESIIADGFCICRDLWQADREAFEILSRVPVSFRYRDAHTELFEEKSLIQVPPHHGAGERPPQVSGLYFNQRTLQPLVLDSPDEVGAFYRAYRVLAAMIEDPRYTFEFKLAPGELLVFHNRRILHGRRGYQVPGHLSAAAGDAPIRHLEGGYADLDGLHSRLRVLSRPVPAAR